MVVGRDTVNVRVDKVAAGVAGAALVEHVLVVEHRHALEEMLDGRGDLLVVRGLIADATGHRAELGA